MLAGQAQPRRADLLAHFEQQFGIEAEPATAGEDPTNCSEVVMWRRPLLSAVPRPVPFTAFGDRQPPRRASVAPLLVIARDDVTVAIDQHRRKRIVLALFGEQQRRRAGHRIGQIAHSKPQRAIQGPMSSVR